MTEQHDSTLHLGAFYGSQLSLEECEEFAYRRVTKARLADEPALMESAWWDYKPLHPVHRAYYFAHVYQQMLRERYAVEVDYVQAMYVKAFSNGKGNPPDDPLFKDSNLQGFWAARQLADAAGARYSVFIRAALIAGRNDGWTHRQTGLASGNQTAVHQFPRPVQFGAESILEAAVQAWQEEQGGYFQLPESGPFYAAGSSFWAKPAFDAYLEAKIARSPLTGESELRPRLQEAGFLF